MKIVIIGDGKVGHKVTTQLAEEDFDITLIDQNAGRLRDAVNSMDVFCIVGNGADANILRQAGVSTADLVIACSSSDEMNMLSCLLARNLGAKHTIARVRNPIYYKQIDLLREDLRLSMTVNPERAAANEISRVLLFPETDRVETFMKGRAELVEFGVKSDSRLSGLQLSDIYTKIQAKMLICAVKRGEDVTIPSGDFILQPGDRIYVAAAHNDLQTFLQAFGHRMQKIKKVLICGGGNIGYYLSEQLLSAGMQVKIIEQNYARCEELCEMLPKATIIHGDASDQSVLVEEGIERADALIALTGMDEENIIISLFGKKLGLKKNIARVNEDSRAIMVEDMLDSAVSVKTATADAILGYVKARMNSIESENVETVYQLVNGKVAAQEFVIKSESELTGVPLKELHLKDNMLIACIGRRHGVIIPDGDTEIQVGDNVIVVTKGLMLRSLKDILIKEERA